MSSIFWQILSANGKLIPGPNLILWNPSEGGGGGGENPVCRKTSFDKDADLMII